MTLVCNVFEHVCGPEIMTSPGTPGGAEYQASPWDYLWRLSTCRSDITVGRDSYPPQCSSEAPSRSIAMPVISDHAESLAAGRSGSKAVHIRLMSTHCFAPEPGGRASMRVRARARAAARPGVVHPWRNSLVLVPWPNIPRK